MKSFIDKHHNLFYALVIFFYIDLCGITIYLLYKASKTEQQIKEDAEQILETPDLTTGLEELHVAVENDLKDMENNFKRILDLSFQNL